MLPAPSQRCEGRSRGPYVWPERSRRGSGRRRARSQRRREADRTSPRQAEVFADGCARSLGSVVASGPAASSASVIAAIANCCGSVSRSMLSSPTITDVSMTPRSGAGSGTRGGILGGVAVKIGAPAIGVDRCCGAEGREGRIELDESAALGRCQFTDGHPLRVTVKLSPASSARMISPLSLPIRPGRRQTSVHPMFVSQTSGHCVSTDSSGPTSLRRFQRV